MCVCGVALYLKRTESSRWRSSRFWSRKACEGFETVQKIRVSVLVLNEFGTGVVRVKEDEEGEGAEKKGRKGRKERVSCALERKGSQAR
jgi:hypothetical protein